MEGGTDAYYIGSNYYAMSVQKTAKAAEILGYEEDKRYYDDLYQKIREAIIREYFTETGRLADLQGHRSFAGFSPKTDSRKTLFISFFRKIIRDGCTASILEQQQSGKDGIPFWMTGI